MKVRTVVIAITALLLPVAAVACSDDSDDKDTTTTTEASTTEGTSDTETTEATSAADADPEVSSALVEAFGLDQAKADCAAAALEPQVSAESLEAIKSGDRDNIPADEVSQVEDAIRTAVESCS